MKYERVSCLFSGGGDDDEQMHNLLMNCPKVKCSDSQWLHVEHGILHTYVHMTVRITLVHTYGIRIHVFEKDREMDLK
jgi:hypothetical protein